MSAEQNPRFGWRQSVVATLKANTFGIRFELCAGSAHAAFGRRTFTGSLYFCAVHARAKMNSIFFAFGELCEAFLRSSVGIVYSLTDRHQSVSFNYILVQIFTNVKIL